MFGRNAGLGLTSLAFACLASTSLGFPARIGPAAARPAPGPTWRPVAAGVEYAALPIEKPVESGDGVLHVLRIDPARAELRAHMASEPGEESRTAQEWCAAKDLVAVINLGMYAMDMRSNVGFARKGAHLNNGRQGAKYKSFLVFDPRRAGIAPAAILDAEDPQLHKLLADYDVVIQNLRLIRAPGQNVWSKQKKRWAEAAIAADAEGRILFLFTRTPFTMWEFNHTLLRLPLRIRNAMHAEGGPEASLSVQAPGFELHLNGSFETGFHEGDDFTEQLAIPNVIGVAAR